MERINLVMLENEDTRYEFYMQGIRRSNIDDTIVEYELKYDRYQLLSSTGGTVSFGNRLYDDFERFVEKLLLKGFRKVDHNTKSFS